MEYCVLSKQTSGITSYFTILYCQKAGMIKLDKKTYQMKSGDMIVCRENIFYEAGNEIQIEILMFERHFFDGLIYSQLAECRIIYEFLHEKSSHLEYLYFTDNDEKEIQTFWTLMNKEMTNEDFHSDKMMHLYLVGVLTILDRKRDAQLIVQNSTMIANNRFGKIMKYMGDHYADCSLEGLAEKFGYHPDYLSVRFKKITGTTFSQKLLSIRLEQSQYLLRTSEMTVEEIANEIGFHDKSYFMKRFKEAYGLTPSKYRKATRQN